MIHQGKVAIVFGGSQGIGKAIVERLLKEAMRVVIAEIDQEAGEGTEREKAWLHCKHSLNQSPDVRART
jgi:NAD(P)-dependent dehydrogenase (short-subunit alcohol dehydrogenase family)